MTKRLSAERIAEITALVRIYGTADAMDANNVAVRELLAERAALLGEIDEANTAAMEAEERCEVVGATKDAERRMLQLMRELREAKQTAGSLESALAVAKRELELRQQLAYDAQEDSHAISDLQQRLALAEKTAEYALGPHRIYSQGSIDDPFLRCACGWRYRLVSDVKDDEHLEAHTAHTWAEAAKALEQADARV